MEKADPLVFIGNNKKKIILFPPPLSGGGIKKKCQFKSVFLHLLLTFLNFFFLDRNVEECAKAHGDKHINKMQLEYAQIASTVVRDLVAKHHPVVKWAIQSRAHVMWIIELGIALDKEKARRAVIALQLLGKKWSSTHKSQAVLEMLKKTNVKCVVF